MTSDPKILALALIGGVAPALIWLWFWLKEDNQRPEPKGLLATIFILGMILVILILPVQNWIKTLNLTEDYKIVIWATVEEIAKFLGVIILLFKTKYIDEPIDWPVFLITSALGFAALENSLFLIEPLSLNQASVSLLTGQLRFLGSTLLHAISSGLIGISLGLSFNFNKIYQKVYLVLGFIGAIFLHSIFNFFIMEDNGSNFLRVFTFLWVVTIIIILLFEKLRRMGEKLNKNLSPVLK